MKKISVLSFVFLMVIVLSGCGEKNITSNQSVPSEAVEKNSQPQQADIADNQGKGDEGNVLNKLKNSIMSGKKVKCVYKMKENNMETSIITYMQGDKYRTEVDLGQVKTISIFDGDVMYNWSVGQKTGTKMTMDCMESLNDDLPESKNDEKVVAGDSDDFVDSLKDAQNLNCEDSSDVDFEIPTEIEFVDQCEMLKTQQKLMEGLGN